MKYNSPVLFIEINDLEFSFIVGDNIEDNFKIIFTVSSPLQGIHDNKITNLDLVCNTLKNNILEIEKKVNFVFKEAILVINNFNFIITSCTGFKKLNGSQLTKENVTYILNSLKLLINDTDQDKKIIHIFNSRFFLDKKETINLPIGLFGNFYSHELSFFLISKNDYKNFNNIFNSCNLKIKKIISKNYIEGVNLIKDNKNSETFFKIEINERNSQIFLFEKSAFKFVQSFKFGSNLILKDISKVIAIKEDIVKEILFNQKFSNENSENEYLEKEFFKNQNFRKIKKKLIYEIAEARINELSEKILFQNLNIYSLLKKNIKIYLKVEDKKIFNCFEQIFISSFSSKRKYELKMIENFNIESLYESANKLVQYGWKKEAVPIAQENKSIISRFFNFIFK
tara:strand:+ start:7236 stop:8429 length:1194 start_codon:yes stop_codon:yes gene_type:complete